MNQFRDITIVVLVILAASLGLGNPENWTWDAMCGPYVVNAVTMLSDARPWSVIILMALALSLFMTRIRY